MKVGGDFTVLADLTGNIMVHSKSSKGGAPTTTLLEYAKDLGPAMKGDGKIAVAGKYALVVGLNVPLRLKSEE